MSSSSSAAAGPSAPKRACDSCHRRKVKCLPVSEGAAPSPCRNCVAAGLECTFYNKVQKKGPKGSRAKVLSEIRETQKFISPRPPTFSSSDDQHASRSQSPSTASQHRSSVGSHHKTSSVMGQALMVACVEHYFASMYAMQPVLHPKCIERTMATMESNVEGHAMIAALCSLVLMQPPSVLSPTLRAVIEMDQPGATSFARILLEEAIRVRRGHEWSENPTLLTVYTNYILFLCYHTLDQQETAWIYLRQALTVAHVLELHIEETYGAEEKQMYSVLRRKLFWMLFIIERVFALRYHRPISLYATIQQPDPRDEGDGGVSILGFLQLIKLYSLLDDRFFASWNNQSSNRPPPVEWLEALQDEIENIAPPMIEYMQVSSLDLLVSKQWLKVMIWRLQNRALPPGTMIDTMQFNLLYKTCKDLMGGLASYARPTLEAHGIDLAEKLYDITVSLGDCCAVQPFGMVFEVRQCLQHLINAITALPVSRPRLVPLLQAKFAEIFGSNLAYTPSDSSGQHTLAMNSPSIMQSPMGHTFGQPSASSIGIAHHPHLQSQRNLFQGAHTAVSGASYDPSEGGVKLSGAGARGGNPFYYMDE